MSAIDDRITELKQLAGTSNAALAAGAAPAAPAYKRLSMAFPIGTPVLDLVTGLKGVVTDGKRENVILPPSPNSGG